MSKGSLAILWIGMAIVDLGCIAAIIFFNIDPEAMAPFMNEQVMYSMFSLIGLTMFVIITLLGSAKTKVMKVINLIAYLSCIILILGGLTLNSGLISF